MVAACASAPVVQDPPRTSGTSAGTSTTTTTAPPATSAPPEPTTTTSLPPPLPEPSPPAVPSPGNNKLLVVGDSVILGAKYTVPRELVGWNVTFDARESRFITNGLDVLKAHKSDFDKLQALHQANVEQAYRDAGLPPPKPGFPASIPDVLGHVVVIHLCTNYEVGGGFSTFIDRIMDYLKDLARVVWITCGEWSAGQTEANLAIKEAATRHPKLVVADWAAYAITPGYTYDDQIHLREPGSDELAKLVSRAVGPAPEPLPPAPTTTLPKPTTTTTTTPPETVPEPSPVP